MRSLLHTEFAALLTRAGVSKAGFARLTGLTARQVNNWCRGRAAVPPWATALAVILKHHSSKAIQQFSFCHVEAGAAASEVTDRHGRQSYGRPYRVENVTRAG